LAFVWHDEFPEFFQVISKRPSSLAVIEEGARVDKHIS
jgi:hypothetical protein